MHRTGHLLFSNRIARPLLAVLLLLAALPTSLASVSHAGAAPVEVGYRDFSYGVASAPTGQKPQSKLWFNDGSWWGSLFKSGVDDYNIFRLDWATQTWADTGTLIDNRTRSSADTLWDGSHLYVASALPPETSSTDLGVRVMRYSYNASTKTYSMDAGFPIVLANLGVEAVVLDKDSAGVIWVTYTADNGAGGRNVYVSHSKGTLHTSWVAPYVLPTRGANNLTADDISAVVAYNGKIGVMWSNQTDWAMYFATHVDGAPDNEWSLVAAVQSPEWADDHLNLKSLQADPAGQVFAAVKTSLNGATDPLILLLTLSPTGSWRMSTVWRVGDDVTRPLVLLDRQNRQVYVFGAAPCCSGGIIYYKRASYDNVSFATGPGDPFIRSSADPNSNNPTSTKQELNGTTGLVVLAGDDRTKFYLHNSLSLGPAPTATPPGTATATPIPPKATPTSTPVPPQPTATGTLAAPTATAAVPPTATPAALTLFADGFESGNFGAWTTVQTGADGSATVQTADRVGGAYAARLSATSTSGSFAYARKSLAAAETSLAVRGDLRIKTEGTSAGNVPIFKLYGSAGNALVALYRGNKDGRLYVEYNGSRYLTQGKLPRDKWKNVELRVVAGGAGIAEVRMDNALIYQDTAAGIDAAGVQTLQIGNEAPAQTFALIADNIVAAR